MTIDPAIKSLINRLSPKAEDLLLDLFAPVEPFSSAADELEDWGLIHNNRSLTDLGRVVRTAIVYQRNTIDPNDIDPECSSGVAQDTWDPEPWDRD